MKRRENSSPLPSGWVHDFMHEADLEKSFRALEGCPHFHAVVSSGVDLGPFAGLRLDGLGTWPTEINLEGDAARHEAQRE